MKRGATLDRLCALAGISIDYQDAWGRSQRVAEEAKRALLAALGYPCANPAERHAAIEELGSRDWRRPLPPVLVVRQPELLQRVALVPLVMPRAQRSDRVLWRLKLEDGSSLAGELSPDGLRRLDSRRLGQTWYVRLGLPLPETLPLGYHRFEIGYAGQSTRSACLSHSRS